MLFFLTAEQTPEETVTELAANSYGAAFFKMLLALFALLVLVFVTVWILKRFSHGIKGRYGSQSIQIVEKRPLSPKSMLYLIEVDGKQILVAESQLEIKTLTTIETLKN